MTVDLNLEPLKVWKSSTIIDILAHIKGSPCFGPIFGGPNEELTTDSSLEPLRMLKSSTMIDIFGSYLRRLELWPLFRAPANK